MREHMILSISQNLYTRFHNRGWKSWKFVKNLQVLVGKFWTCQNWGFKKFHSVWTSLILFSSQYFDKKVIIWPKFEIFSEILWRENQPCDTIFGLFVYHGRMWFLKLIKPNDFAPSRISRSIFGQFRSN